MSHEIQRYGSLLGGPAPPAKANIRGEIVQVQPRMNPPPEGPPPGPRNAINPPPPETRRGLFRPDEVPPQSWFVAMVVEYELDCDDGPQHAGEDDCWCSDCEEDREQGREPRHIHEIYEVAYHPKILTTRFCEAYPTEAEAEARLRDWLSRHMPTLPVDGSLSVPTGSDVLVHLEEVHLWGKEAVEDFIARNRWKLGK